MSEPAGGTAQTGRARRQAAQTQPPEGFRYVAAVLTEDEQQEVLEWARQLPFGEVRLHGVVAKRRVAHFGWVYEYETWQLRRGPPMPRILVPVRGRLAACIQLPEATFEEALVTDYPAGAGIGWHRDAPMFGPVVIGVSLGGPGRLRFRRGPGHPVAFEQRLEPRSAYVLAGASRSIWQHSLPPVEHRRLSITFRTLRPRASGSVA